MQVGIDGTDLGHYRVTRLLGSGGMGEVYLARDLLLGRDVAVKVVTTAHEHGDSLIRRLLHEAKAVAALDHPCICPVHDAGVDAAGRPYMVMQYVPGETLAVRLQRGPLPVHDALLLTTRIADALAFAHASGIVHRDLKPQNVMITPTGEPRLLDFGIAKVLPSAHATGTTDTMTALTGAYALVGTPAYMSPEQVRHQPVDGRSDLFSLGAILFETLTGRRAFPGGNTTEVLSEILHVHPPAVSELREDLDERYDEVCRRLLAKDRLDRFQSANEVIGALRILLPDTSRSVPDAPVPMVARGWRGARDVVFRHRWTTPAVIGTAIGALGLLAGVTSMMPARPPPPEAAAWFDRGTRALREGAFHTAQRAFEEGLARYPHDVLAYARIAEARAGLGDERGAQEALVRLSDRVADQTSLPRGQRLRLEAVRALVLGNPDGAVHAYTDLSAREPRDASVWLDLARAQEQAALLADAEASCRRALALDPQYAAAQLRLGVVANAQGRRDDALLAFGEAERLYRTASNVEGQAEVCIRRGLLLDAKGDLPGARAALEHALALSESVDDTYYRVRARMGLSSVTASEGNREEAEHLASEAVRSALEAGLESVAAEGLIGLAIALQTSRPDKAAAVARQSAATAERLGARRIAARATAQLAAIQSDDNPAQALVTIQPALAFFREHHYRSYELSALAIAARAYQRVDDVAAARELTADMLREAETMRDDRQIALAVTNLALQATALGLLPEALAHRERAEAIHRRQNDLFSLGYDLTNRAELLILLGERARADEALREVETGIANHVAAYLDRRKRVEYVRFLDAVVSHRSRDVALGRAVVIKRDGVDIASVLTPAMLAYARARQRQAIAEVPVRPTGPPIPPYLDREARYWRAATLVQAGHFAEASAAASAGLSATGRITNDELRWRVAAVGVVAARALGRTNEERALRATATDALSRLRASWQGAAAAYERRPDLTELKRAAGL